MSSNIEVKLDVLNQKASPALYAAALANRPAASFTGRLFVDSDSPSTGIYRDTGTTWVQVADQGAGTTGTLQQVTLNGSSTTIGLSTSGNGIGIGTTIPGSNRLDIHSGTGIQATLNGTGTTNAALQFQLAGVGKWTLQNNYNAANNDFVITDVLNASNRITVTNQGQTFIGANTTSSGLLVVNNVSSDSHIVVLGANSPSIRIRDSGSSLVQNVGIGISTGTNAFIQGSANGNFCFFNSSTTASPILFGVYDAGTNNTQEAVRISAARNFLIGTTTDAGYKLDVNGTGRFTGNVTVGTLITNYNQILGLQFFKSGASGVAGNLRWDLESAGTESTGNVGSDFTLYRYDNTGTYLGTTLTITRSTGAATFSSSVTANFDIISKGSLDVYGGTGSTKFLITTAGSGWGLGLLYDASNVAKVVFNANGNSYLNGGNIGIGTTSPSYLLDVNGTGRFSGAILSNSSIDVGTSSSGYKIGIIVPSGANTNLMIAGVSGVTNGMTLRYVTATTRIVLNIANIPTSAGGLISGDIYSNAGILTIVP